MKNFFPKYCTILAHENTSICPFKKNKSKFVEMFWSHFPNCWRLKELCLLWWELRDKVLRQSSLLLFIHFSVYIHVRWPPEGTRQFGRGECQAAGRVSGCWCGSSWCLCQVIIPWYVFVTLPPWPVEHHIGENWEPKCWENQVLILFIHSSVYIHAMWPLVGTRRFGRGERQAASRASGCRCGDS
jgi:hypothetical protein